MQKISKDSFEISVLSLIKRHSYQRTTTGGEHFILDRSDKFWSIVQRDAILTKFVQIVIFCNTLSSFNFLVWIWGYFLLNSRRKCQSLQTVISLKSYSCYLIRFISCIDFGPYLFITLICKCVPFPVFYSSFLMMETF